MREIQFLSNFLIAISMPNRDHTERLLFLAILFLFIQSLLPMISADPCFPCSGDGDCPACLPNGIGWCHCQINSNGSGDGCCVYY